MFSIVLNFRYNRVFLPYPQKADTVSNDEHRENCNLVKAARVHLKYLCEKTLQRNERHLDIATEQRCTDSLLAVVKCRREKPLEDFIMAFVNRTEEAQVTQSMAHLLLLLSGDAPISSVVPFNYHHHILQTCAAIRSNVDIDKKLHDMKQYGVELSNVLKICKLHQFGDKCTSFVEYLVDQVIDTHYQDKPVQEPQQIPNSYNPEKGTAYYFTPHGNQIRKQPIYCVQQAKKNYDDVPCVDDICRKNFPTVSYGGFGYMFLWFCPIHGHCYGVHLISGGEGRKDPFSSLFKYMPTAPTDIFYDFACQLSEYCLNREPQYFLNTRFWHDLFHGISHKCGKCFKSSRICGMVGINSEICEQFNSYLQCIKYTGSHLSQSHFMFFVQFFIYQWNIEKTAKFQGIVGIALAGVL